MNCKMLIKKPTIFLALITIAVLSFSCSPKPKEEKTALPEKGTFGYDLNFLVKYQETILLEDGNAQILICPAYQGRVMTSTANGVTGLSYGWLNYDLIESGKIVDKINAVGGEDRFWLGPEGGQFSIFFKKGDPFNLDTWQTPAVIDTEPFNLVSKNEISAVFEKDFKIENYSGNEFKLKVERSVILFDLSRFETISQIKPPDQRISILRSQF